MKMKKLALLIVLGVFITSVLCAQDEPLVGGMQWGFKLGPSMGMRGGTSPLFRYHGVAFIEGGGNENSSLYAAVGYHARGIAPRFTPLSLTPTFRTVSIPSVFHNISLSFGMKKKYDYANDLKYYYLFGMRGEFTAKTNLPYLDVQNPKQQQQINNTMFSNYVRRFNWGMDIGGGLERPFSELVTGFLEFRISPDFSFQYRFANLGTTPNTGIASSVFTNGFKNLSLELSLGIRFWNKVIYE